MIPRVPRVFPLATCVLLATALGRADDSKAADDGAPSLPPGAKLRFGKGHLVFRSGFTLLPPDYATILAADSGNGLRRFDVATGRPLDAPRGQLTTGAMVVSGDGKRLVGLHTGILSVRGVLTGAGIKQLPPPAGFGTTNTSNFPPVSFSADGKRLAQGGSVGAKAAAIVWDVDKAEVLVRIETDLAGIAIPVLAADGKTVAVRQYGFNAGLAPGKNNDPQRSIHVWDVDGKKELLQARVSPPSYQSPDVALSSDGSLMAASFGDGPIQIWDVKTSRYKHMLLGRTGQGVRIAFSPDGKRLAAAAYDGTIQRWNMDDGKLIGTTEPTAGAMLPIPLGVAFAGKDRVVAWSASGYAALVWEAPSGKLLTPRNEHAAAIKSIGFGAGGKELISAGLDGRVIRWDLASGKPLGTVDLRPGRNSSVIPGLMQSARPALGIARDGSYGVTATTPAAVFDLTTGAELFVFPRGPIRSSFHHLPSADASKVLTFTVPLDATQSAVYTLWDVAERKIMVEFDTNTAPEATPAAAFSPDGTRMVMAGPVRNPGNRRRGFAITGWDLKNGKKLGEIDNANAGGAMSIAAANNTSAVVSTSLGRIYAVDFEAGRMGEEIENLRRGDGIGSPVVFTPDGKKFAVAATGEAPNTYTIRIYDWPRARHLHTFTGHSASITALTFSPDGNYLVSGSQDTTALLWDMSAVKDKQ
jgi:WD40 repeat protein